MAVRGADAARDTLDTRSVARDAGGDRPYLASLLRRLGYSEGDIAAYLAGGELRKGAPAAPAPTAGTRAALASTSLPSAPRDIEVEYTGPGLRDYRFVVALEGEPPAQQVFEEAPPQPVFEQGEEQPAAWTPPAEERAAQPEPEPLVGFEAVEEEPLVGFEAVEEEPQTSFEAVEEPAMDSPAPEAPAEDPEPAEPQAEEPPQVWAEEPPGFQQDGWRLYSKDEGEGKEAHRIFFFSKEQPGDAVASEVPEGYEVAVNPETGRPFLRRIQDEEPSAPIDTVGAGSETAVDARKRVRIVRVRAASREEAQRKLESQGRHVLATMPVDIQKKVQ